MSTGDNKPYLGSTLKVLIYFLRFMQTLMEYVFAPSLVEG